MESIARGAFEATGCEILLFSNHSPCGMCSDSLCQFMSTYRRVTLSIKFKELYRTHGSNNDNLKRKNKNGLKKLYNTANVTLSVMTPDDWLDLLRPIRVNRRPHFGVVRILSYVERWLYAADNMERSVSEIERATHLIQRSCGTGQHWKIERQMFVVRNASMKMRQDVTFIRQVVNKLFCAINGTTFASIALEECNTINVATQRVGVLRNDLDNACIMYTESVSNSCFTTETKWMLRDINDLILRSTRDFVHLSQIMNSGNGESVRIVMYTLVRMDIRFEDMLDEDRQNKQERRLGEIVADE